MRTLPSIFTAAFLAACGGTITTNGTDAATESGSPDASQSADSSTTPDALPPFDAGTFCSGTTPRLMINGSEVTVMQATGKQIVLNCCDSAEVTVASSAFQALMYVMWRAQGSMNGTIDLANPPQGFGIEMDLGCDPSTASCATASPAERYTDGFSGTIEYATGNGGLAVNYCIRIAESPTQPHPMIHSMMLYAPGVISP